MNKLDVSKLYLYEGLVGLGILLFSVPVSINYFIEGSVLFSVMMPFIILTMLLSIFGITVDIKHKSTRY